jgi:adenylate kinase
MRVVFLGAPGVGKGTQADRIAAQYQVAKISTGDLSVRRFAIRQRWVLKQRAIWIRGTCSDVVIGLVRENSRSQLR